MVFSAQKWFRDICISKHIKPKNTSKMNKKHFRKDRMTCMALQPCTYQSKRMPASGKCYTLMDICRLHSHVPIMHCDRKHIKSNYCIFCTKIRCRTVSSCTLLLLTSSSISSALKYPQSHAYSHKFSK